MLRVVFCLAKMAVLLVDELFNRIHDRRDVSVDPDIVILGIVAFYAIKRLAHKWLGRSSLLKIGMRLC